MDNRKAEIIDLNSYYSKTLMILTFSNDRHFFHVERG